MSIVFAGTPAFAATHLQALIAAGVSVAVAYTQPDRPAGRGRRLQSSAVKEVAVAHGIPVRQPASLRDPQAGAELAGYRPELLVVVAYGLILPPAVLAVPRFGCVNVHASLLPRWRGAAPIQRALLAGDAETGICLMRMDAGLDTGPVLRRHSCPISPRDTAATLEARLAALGAAVLVEALPDLLQGSVPAVPQALEGITYAAKVHKAEAELDWSRSAVALDRQVRAFNPWPVACTGLGGRPLRIWEAEPVHAQRRGEPGRIERASGQGIDVATGAGVLRLWALQSPGARVVSAQDFANAHPDLEGRLLGPAPTA